MNLLLKRVIVGISRAFTKATAWHRVDPNTLDRQLQILLSENWKKRQETPGSLPSFPDVEFSSFSQNGEDGILLFIFSLIGTTNKTAVEICAGDGIECNAANLINNHGWSALLFDGDIKAIRRGDQFYSQRTSAWRFSRRKPELVHAWVTSGNVNDLIRDHGCSGEVDLLSLDMDGVDYWIWKAITCVSPRVVILEYNNRWNADQSVTVPYSESFAGIGASVEGQGYFGASLPAFVKLAQEKGYRLIGSNGPDTNAFFLRNDVGVGFFPEVSAKSCLASAYAIHQHQTKYPLIKDMPVVEV
jgi:hypothetical protein